MTRRNHDKRTLALMLRTLLNCHDWTYGYMFRQGHYSMSRDSAVSR